MVTAPYHIKLSPAAFRYLKTLNHKQQKILVHLIETLAINPRPPGVNRIEGMIGLYRDTIDHSEIIYKVEDQEVLILIIKSA